MSELKPTDAAALLQTLPLPLPLLLLVMVACVRPSVEGALAATPGRAARRQSATARLAPLPGRPAGAEWAGRRGPVSREITPQAPPLAPAAAPRRRHYSVQIQRAYAAEFDFLPPLVHTSPDVCRAKIATRWKSGNGGIGPPDEGKKGRG